MYPHLITITEAVLMTVAKAIIVKRTIWMVIAQTLHHGLPAR